MRSSLQATLGRRRNSRALAVSLESLNSAGAKTAKSPHDNEEATLARLPSQQRALALIAGDDDDDDDFFSVAKFTPRRDRTRNVTEETCGVVKEGRRKGRDRRDTGSPGISSFDADDACSSASTPSHSTRVSYTNLLRSKETGQVFHLSEGFKVHQLHSGAVLPVLENRLYLQSSPPAPAQKELPGVHFFTWDNAMVNYFPLCADFGPFNLGMTHYFCQFLKDLLGDSKHSSKKLILYTSPEDCDVTNAIYLLGSFLCLNLGATVEEAWMPFSNIAINPCIPYCDASWVSPSVYDLHVTDCWAGLLKALRMGLYNPKEFNHEEYLYYDDPCNGDMHEVVPGKFLAFKGPTEDRKPLGNGRLSFLPTDYGAVFEVKEVRTIVRLTEEKAYDRAWLVNQGYHLHDLAVPEGSTPSEAVVDKFLKIAESSKAPIAVHCESGLGPTPTLIGMYMMKHLDFTADEAIAWLRICRPGSVIGPQQRYLEQQEQHMRSLGMMSVSGLGLEDASAVTDPTVDDETEIAGAPDHGARFGAALAMELASALRKGMEARDQAKLSMAAATGSAPGRAESHHDDPSQNDHAASNRCDNNLPVNRDDSDAPPADASATPRGRSTLASETPRCRRPSSASAAERPLAADHGGASVAGMAKSGPSSGSQAGPGSAGSDAASESGSGSGSGASRAGQCKCKELKRPMCTCSNGSPRVNRARFSMLRQWTSETSLGSTCTKASPGSSRSPETNLKLREPHPPSGQPTSSFSAASKSRFTGRARPSAGATANAAQQEPSAKTSATDSQSAAARMGSRREA